MEQCWVCEWYVFLKPLPDETFAFCRGHEETVKDVDLRKGVSPAIEFYGWKGEACRKFKAGTSISHPPKNRPFDLHPVRRQGEEFLRNALGI